jgi:hypothetical protein
MEQKAQADRIRSILRQHWDPAGVKDAPEAFDEYDSYIPRIQASALGGDANAICAYLIGIEANEMMLAPNKPRALAVAKEIVAAISVS